MAVYLAQQGAKCLIAMSRSSFEDEKSKKVAADIAATGAKIILITGDVTKMGDVDRLFNCSPVPVRGIVHGAMVLKVSKAPV
jgi:NAD(P)-dependent dehydrogenase (short-subunit alcohol dehydrogenase family)